MTTTKTTTSPTTPPTSTTTPATRGRKPRRRLLIGLAAALAVLAGYTAWTNTRPYTLEASIEIAATPEQVWAILTDLPAYPEWNPFIVSSTGKVQQGATLTNRMRDTDGETTTFTPTVLAVKPGRELRWLGKIGPGGIVDGEHSFLIQPIGPGRVRLTQHEDFTGVLIPFFQHRLATNTLPQFRAMNTALAQRATTNR
jgi:hypothetical protein